MQLHLISDKQIEDQIMLNSIQYDSFVFRKMVQIRLCSGPDKVAYENTYWKILERGVFASRLLSLSFQWKQ